MKIISKIFTMLLMLTLIFTGCGKKDEVVHESEEQSTVVESAEEIEVIESTEQTQEDTINEEFSPEFPTCNDIYLSLLDSGIDSNKLHVSDQQGFDGTNDVVLYETPTSNDRVRLDIYETAKLCEDNMNGRITAKEALISMDPEINYEVHECYEFFSREDKNGCDVYTIKRTAHDRHCNAITNHGWVYDDLGNDVIIRNFNILIDASYGVNENSEALNEDISIIFDVLKELGIITY